MSIWISTLYESGVNLKGYGLRERLTWVNLEEFMDVETVYNAGGITDYRSYYYFGRKCVLGFNYGPFPEIWRVWENEPTDEFVGDFWLMLNKRMEAMPIRRSNRD
jgi:hypothetical protein